MALLRGVVPLTMPYRSGTDALIRAAEALLLKERLVRKGDPVVLLSGRLGVPAAPYMTKVHYVGGR
jgi:pyruvate kinase